MIEQLEKVSKKGLLANGLDKVRKKQLLNYKSFDRYFKDYMYNAFKAEFDLEGVSYRLYHERCYFQVVWQLEDLTHGVRMALHDEDGNPFPATLAVEMSDKSGVLNSYDRPFTHRANKLLARLINRAQADLPLWEKQNAFQVPFAKESFGNPHPGSQNLKGQSRSSADWPGRTSPNKTENYEPGFPDLNRQSSEPRFPGWTNKHYNAKLSPDHPYSINPDSQYTRKIEP